MNCQKMQSSENGTKSTSELVESEQRILSFLDSMDSYLILMDTLSSSLRQAQKERFKSLSMFGTLVSPKLRATQLSFETALEMLIEIANVRASLLRGYDQVQSDLNLKTA